MDGGRAVSLLMGMALLALSVTGWIPKPSAPVTPSPSRIAPRLVTRGETTRRVVAITIDDGPHPYTTARLLTVLRDAQVPATFFVVGKQVRRHPTLLRCIAADGHTIGNHTENHLRLTGLPPARVRAEIRDGGEIIRLITGMTPRYFRPPGGQWNAAVVDQANGQGYVTVLWTDAARDYERPGDDAITLRTTARVRPGAILLLHDGIYQTVDALPGLIARLRKDGYTFVTLDALVSGATLP